MPPEQWNPAPTRRDSRALGLPTTTRTSRNGPSNTPTDRHERSGLVRIELVQILPQYGPLAERPMGLGGSGV
jgi:hypothetical protein